MAEILFAALGGEDESQPGRWLAVAAAAPLAGVLGLLLQGWCLARPRPRLACGVAWLAAGLAFGAATVGLSASWSLPPGTLFQESIPWIELGPYHEAAPAGRIDFGYRVDRFTALFVFMVTLVTGLILVYSGAYLAEEAQPRVHDLVAGVHRRGRQTQYWLYLLLFEFSMIWLLLADDWVQLFMGWELVGFCSYLLIGFYSERPRAVAAANKAFLMNRIGDAGLLVVMMIAWSTWGTLNLSECVTRATAPGGWPNQFVQVAFGLALLGGTLGKSAQWPLQDWLKDAMEGPTPVSALMHAATMVAAGVYLVARAYPLLGETPLLVLGFLGLITALGAAFFALWATDIKRILAYSTMSQLGFMLVALAVGGWRAGVFHLLTHACFKALLFLSAGAVIHGTHHEQDLRRLGGLRRAMPGTAALMALGVLAILGVPFFSGWASKEQILAATFGLSIVEPRHAGFFWGLWFTAGLTAAYMSRLWLGLFAGQPRSHAAQEAQEAPRQMLLTMVVLALPTVALGWGWPFWQAEAGLVSQLLESVTPPGGLPATAAATRAAHEHHLWVLILPLIAILAGVSWAWQSHRRSVTTGRLEPPTSRGARWAAAEGRISLWYDQIAPTFATTTARVLARIDRRPDGNPGPTATPARFDWTTLDGWANLPADLLPGLAAWVARRQTGNLRTYLQLVVLWLLLGLIALGAWRA